MDTHQLNREQVVRQEGNGPTPVSDLDRQIVGEFSNIRLNLFLEFRIDRTWKSRNVFQVIDGGALLALVGKAVAVFEGGQFESMNLARHIRNLAVESRIIGIQGGRIEEKIQCAVKLFFGAIQKSLFVQVLAVLERT